MLLISLAMNTAARVQPKNILLVDDDREVREAIKLLLAIDRHTVTEAGNGREALQLFTGSNYDLVITDYLMPEMLGDELARKIRIRAPAQPILMITAYLEKLGRIRQPADAVLGKPISLDNLRQAMAMPVQTTPPPQATADSSSVEFSHASLAHRASATSSVLDDILRRQRRTRSWPGWERKR